MQLTRRQVLLEEYPEYSPEWGCSDCKSLKKELGEYEDSYSIIRDHLEHILELHEALILEMPYSKSFNTYIKLFKHVLSICTETAVDFSESRNLKIAQVK